MHSLIWLQEPLPSLQALTGGSTGAINPAHFDADHHSHGSDMAMDTLRCCMPSFLHAQTCRNQRSCHAYGMLGKSVQHYRTMTVIRAL